MSLSSQTSSEPRAFNAALYSFQLVVRYFGFTGALMQLVYPRNSSAAGGGDLCNKALLVPNLQKYFRKQTAYAAKRAHSVGPISNLP